MCYEGALAPVSDRVTAGALFGILAASTLLISSTAAWPLFCIEAGVSALFLVHWLRRKSHQVNHKCRLQVILVSAVTAWGVLQYATHETSDRHLTLVATLQWFAILLTFSLCVEIFASRELRSHFLTALVCFGVALALIELAGAAHPSGEFLWFIPTSYSRLHASFPYYNNFAEFEELIIPIAVFRAILTGNRIWAFAGGVAYASVIVSGSRAGAILSTIEVVAVTVAAILRHPLRRKVVPAVVALALVAAGLTVIAWGNLALRFQQDHPLAERALLNRSSVSMIAARPWMGFGLGTYSTVYPAFARFDVGRYVNHAHNDWAEWAAEGGLPVLLAMAALVVASFRPAVQSLWGVGLIAVSIHAIVDYPFQRFGVAAWIFVLLAAVLAHSVKRASASFSVSVPGVPI